MTIRFKRFIRSVFKLFSYEINSWTLKKIEINRPSLQAVKDKFGTQQIIGAEVGVAEGNNAMKIYKMLNLKKFYLIDSWDKSFNEEDINNMLEEVKEKFKGKDNVKIIKSDSINAIKLLEPLDFVYLDSSHTYEDTIKEVETYWKLIKQGGIMGGHDIENKPSKPNGVFKAVSEFSVKHNLNVYVSKCDWWIVK